MNYFAHGRRFLADPGFLAGTAVPDWLNVVDRRIRARAKTARGFVGHPDPLVDSLARGIIQHHWDDDWFHATRAFTELNLSFAVGVRQHLPPDDGFRPAFVGHILVELLLDSQLIAEEPPRLEDYYAALASPDPVRIAAALGTITGKDVSSLGLLIPRFVAERFLCDYRDDAKLLTRLNHIMRRVQLPALPESLREFFPAARQAVASRRDELLAGESAACDPV